jgi:MFS family permease
LISRPSSEPGVLTANVGTFFASFIMAGGMFLSVLYGQLLAGTSAAAIGVLLAPCAVATLAVAPAAGRLSDSLGPRNLAVAGLAGLAVSVALPVLWHPSSAAAPRLVVEPDCRHQPRHRGPCASSDLG